MSQAPSVDAGIQQRLAALLAPILPDLAEVDARLRAELRNDDPFVNELAQHSFRMSGKRLRPALLLLTARAVGEINDDHRTLAAVVEMIHTATLVHDDVLDEAEVRRHVATVNARWSNQTSVLLGDYLFTHAFYLASTLETTFGCRTIGRATNIVCEGELRQTASSGDFSLSRDDYFAIVEAKTAELTACACLLGAHYAGANASVAEELQCYGRELGVAFQIADDLLDLEGDEQAAGKSLGTDLANRKMTLPLITLRDRLDDAERNRLMGLFEEPIVESQAALLEWLADSGALQEAREEAAGIAAAAVARLDVLADSPAKAALAGLGQFVVKRNA